ncbi:hypothetical protein J5N97_026154 [Dioscorea zingiberensis]|uniref:TF-B3 domain-containing protein n=1 Tax=Dioscorea zingiberensis TaxID=325984 RepID=A0A9D5C1J7_9LILI|nr:hypothetical protein J5N97_026154 [Dioscorea zingiberensis]
MDGTRRPQFFKIFLSGSKTFIPPAFVEHIIDDNHGKATIFSGGKFWNTKVQKSDEGLYFGDGWLELVEAHGLSEGFFLIFRYEGNMVFTLKVFDPNGCRIYDFPITGKCLKNTGKCLKKRKANIEVHDLEEVSVDLHRAPLTHSREKTLIVPPKHSTAGMKLEKENTHAENQIQCQKKIFQSNLVYSIIGIPLSFCTSIGLVSSQGVILRDPQRRLWPVKFSYSPQTPKFMKGWGEFSLNNNLEIGDSCTFTYVSKEDNLIDVHISKAGA